MAVEEVTWKSFALCVHCVPVHTHKSMRLTLEIRELLVVLVHLTNNFDGRMMRLKAY